VKLFLTSVSSAVLMSNAIVPYSLFLIFRDR